MSDPFIEQMINSLRCKKKIKWNFKSQSYDSKNLSKFWGVKLANKHPRDQYSAALCWFHDFYLTFKLWWRNSTPQKLLLVHIAAVITHNTWYQIETERASAVKVRDWNFPADLSVGSGASS